MEHPLQHDDATKNSKPTSAYIQRIKMSTLSRAQYSQLKTAYRGKYASSVDTLSIADLYKFVKTYDKDFSPAPEVSEYIYVHEILAIEEGAVPFKTGTVTSDGDSGGNAPSMLVYYKKCFLSTLRKDINENAELTGSDILSQKIEKGPDISSASNNSIPQKTDLSSPNRRKMLLKLMRGTKYVVECVPDSENKRLHVESAYIEKTVAQVKSWT